MVERPFSKVKGQALKALESGRSFLLPPSEYSRARGFTGARRAIAIFLLGGLLTVLHAASVLAGAEFAPSSVAKGVLLVSSPSLEDPNFRQAVVLVVEHGPGGTIGLILNRSTNVLLSKALPDIAVLKGTSYRLFAGGPVEPTRFLLLFRLKEPPADARLVFDGVYLGRTPKVLERIITKAKPTETFRAFAGFSAWAPRQLEAEMLLRAWAILPPDSGIFDQDPSKLWQDCISRLQAPRVEGVAWVVPFAHGTPTINRWSFDVRSW
jgi:putative transcriptional regulator